MVSVYHALPGWRTRRQHLSLVAPYFSYPVVMSLFGVGQAGSQVRTAISQASSSQEASATVVIRTLHDGMNRVCVCVKLDNIPIFINSGLFVTTRAARHGASNEASHYLGRTSSLDAKW